MSDESSADKSESGGGSAWSGKSITGGIAAVGTLIAAVAALLNGVNAWRPKQESASPTPSSNARLVAKPAVSPSANAPPANSLQQEYRVGSMSDGWAAVRDQPSVNGAMLEQLPSGTHLVCGHEVTDKDPGSPRRWRFCAAHRGYVAARLLIRL